VRLEERALLFASEWNNAGHCLVDADPFCERVRADAKNSPRDYENSRDARFASCRRRFADMRARGIRSDCLISSNCLISLTLRALVTHELLYDTNRERVNICRRAERQVEPPSEKRDRWTRFLIHVGARATTAKAAKTWPTNRCGRGEVPTVRSTRKEKSPSRMRKCRPKIAITASEKFHVSSSASARVRVFGGHDLKLVSWKLDL